MKKEEKRGNKYNKNVLAIIILIIVILLGFSVIFVVRSRSTKEEEGLSSLNPLSWLSKAASWFIKPECSDKKDNDADGRCDYSGCYIGRGKNKVWYPYDPDCTSTSDNSEACIPSTEICDGKDNNCNGLIDEYLTRQCGVSNIGKCTFGIETCINGIWKNCDAVMPSDEVCTGGLDEDCDGLIDSKDPDCITDPCLNINSCPDYTSQNACENDTCNVGKCEWNTSSRICKEKNISIECTTDSNCNDGNTCTIDYCEAGKCKILKDPFCSNVTFTKMSPGRVPLFEGDWDPGAASDPSVIKDGNLYRMFYTAPGADGDSTAIWEATSSDGLTWDVLGAYRTSQGVVINYGARGTWEEKLETVDVIKLGNTYYAYYIGYDRNISLGMEVFPSFLGAATSQNGVSFTKYGKPILKNQSNFYDYDSGIISPTVIEDGGHLYMVYTAHCYTQGQCLKTGVNLVGAENTSDPFNWKKTGLQLQYNSNVQWYRNGVAESSLIKIHSKYYLFFTGVDYQTGKRYIGIARSNNPNGPWEIRQDPIISPKNLGDFDYPEALAPDVIFENNKIRMWYTGFEGHEAGVEGLWKIGYAEANLTI